MESISVAKFLAIPTAFLLSGYGIGFSQNSVPLLYNQPASVSAPILEGIFFQGGKFVVPGAILASTSFGYLAYRAPTTFKRNLYAIAALIMFAPPPWTALVMKPGINRMIEIGRSAVECQKADASGEAVKLLQGWVWQNEVRVLFALVSGALGWYAHLQ